MIIRRATVEDAAAIAQVGIACWNETYRGIVPDSHLDGMDLGERTQWAEKTLQASDNGTFTFVVEEEGAVVGYAGGGPNRWTDPNYQGELYTLYLLRRVQKQGTGRRLVQAVAQELVDRGHTNMLVGVLRDNPARGFYERLGAVYVKEGSFIVDGVEIMEMAYGWSDLRALLTKLEDR